MKYGYFNDGIKFLSTPSARRATGAASPALQQAGFLSTPSARRATADYVIIPVDCDISIHALREEGDSARRVWPSAARNFYPRPPRGGRHVAVKNTAQVVDISIHALREEGDDSLLMG